MNRRWLVGRLMMSLVLLCIAALAYWIWLGVIKRPSERGSLIADKAVTSLISTGMSLDEVILMLQCNPGDYGFMSRGQVIKDNVIVAESTTLDRFSSEQWTYTADNVVHTLTLHIDDNKRVVAIASREYRNLISTDSP